MTLGVYFYAEQAYLSFVKKQLGRTWADRDEEVEHGALCVIALACTMEAISNYLLRNHTPLRHYGDLRFRSKIDTIFDFGKQDADWSKDPLYSVGQLIAIRNWLVHYKDPWIGLLGSEEEYLLDSLNKLPKRDPDVELVATNIKKLYDATRQAAFSMAEGLGVADDFQFLVSENYESFLVG